MKLLYLLSHVPNPRIYKRMKNAKSHYEISTIYWKRSFVDYISFFNDSDISKYEFTEKNKNIYTLSVAERLKILIKFMFMALKTMKNIKPDTIHCEHLDMLFISVMYKYIYKNNVKIIYEVADLHEIVYSDSKKLSSKIQRLLFTNAEKILCKKINKLILTSPYFWDDYYSKFISKDDMLFIPNAPEKRVLKNISNGSKEKLTIGFIGAVRYTKQLKMLIDIADETKLINVFIAGNGSSYNEIAEYSKGISNVTMNGAYDYEKEISKLYSKVDIVYSVYDTNSKNVRVALPNRLYESIVLNKPIIASKNTKLGEFIESNGIGFLVNDQEKEDLKLLIKKLITNEKQIIDRCKNNCKKIEEEYYADYYNDKLNNLYYNSK